HEGADEMGSSSPALTAFKVTIGCGGTAFSRLENIRIHTQAHRATRFAPIEARFLENTVQLLFLCGSFDLLGAGHDHGVNFGRNMLAFNELGHSPKIFHARVGAGPDKHS